VGSYDLMLVDWRLPELDGLEAIRLIRAAERARQATRTPILVVTASAMPSDRRRCLEAGADDVVDKPIDFDELATTLGRWMRAAQRATEPRTATALVADDHVDNQQLVARLLELNGFSKVDGVANGQQAVLAWECGDYDLLLIDWKMPVLGGLDALSQIRTLERQRGRRRTPVVVVSGRVGDAERAACVAAGADECVAKPYVAEELIAAAERALRSARPAANH